MSGVTGRAGADYERDVADHAVDRGLTGWERAPRWGNNDKLDLIGTLPAGYLVGTKAIRRTSYAQWRAAERAKGRLGDDLTLEDAYAAGVKAGRGRMSEAMDQCDQALINVGCPSERVNGKLIVANMGIMPVQVMQRSGYPIGKHYAITQLDYFLSHALERAKERAER